MQILWKPNRNAARTLHLQIYDYIIEQISQGHWPLETRLPAERHLAEIWDVNRSTVSQVLDELRSEGVLISKGSKGTFVTNNTWSIMASSTQPGWHRHLEQGIHQPNRETIQLINRYEFEGQYIRLGTGEISPELFPKEFMTEMTRKLDVNLTAMNYEPPLGFQPLREVLSEHLESQGIQASPNQILIVSGSLQALSLIALGLMEPGSSVYVEKPSYLTSLNVMQSAGMTLREVNMTEDGLDLEDLSRTLKRKRTDMLYTIPTFHNPTAALMPMKNRKKLMEIISEHRLPVIEDDAYRDLWLDEPPPPPLKSMDENGNILYIGTLSKSFSPGIRTGWIAGPEAVIERLGDIKMQTDYGSSSLSQHIAYLWLKDGYHQRYQKKLRTALTDKLNHVMKILDKGFSDIASWNRPRGGFYIWLTLTVPVDVHKLFHAALAEKVLINPGYMYDSRENHAIRLSIAYASKEELDYGLNVLERLIRSQL